MHFRQDETRRDENVWWTAYLSNAAQLLHNSSSLALALSLSHMRRGLHTNTHTHAHTVDHACCMLKVYVQ